MGGWVGRQVDIRQEERQAVTRVDVLIALLLHISTVPERLLP